MEIMAIIKDLLKAIWSLSADQIATISLAITLLLFVVGKRSENKIKIYETRKEEYRKLMMFFHETLAMHEKSTEELAKDEDLKKQFLDLGSSLAIFGSKKLYKTYRFYRQLSLDTTLQKNRWYAPDMMVYCFGEMYQIMRKEIGLNRDFIPIDVPDLLASYINDFTKPEFKKRFYKYHFNKFALESAIFWGKIEEFVPFVWILNYLIKPFFFTLFCIVRFPIKLLIITPIRQFKKTFKK